jgi:hypothetical protein
VLQQEQGQDARGAAEPAAVEGVRTGAGVAEAEVGPHELTPDAAAAPWA